MWLLYLVFGIVIVVDFMLLRMMWVVHQDCDAGILIFADYPADQHGDLWLRCRQDTLKIGSEHIEKCIDHTVAKNAIYTFDAGHYSSTGSCDISDSAHVDVRFFWSGCYLVFLDSVA